MKVIIINGYPEAGKDAFIDACQKFSDKVFRLWTSTPAKEALKLLGWDGVDKSPKVRNMLSRLKNVYGKFFDGTMAYIEKEISKLSQDSIVFIHCREPKEIEKLKEKYDGITLLIDRGMPKTPLTNASDALVRNYDYDVIINNKGTLSGLEHIAVKFIRELEAR